MPEPRKTPACIALPWVKALHNKKVPVKGKGIKTRTDQRWGCRRCAKTKFPPQTHGDMDEVSIKDSLRDWWRVEKSLRLHVVIAGILNTIQQRWTLWVTWAKGVTPEVLHQRLADMFYSALGVCVSVCECVCVSRCFPLG